jgi:hypothetical protein
MIQSFGSETIFRWEECGKNHTLGAKESNPGCHGCFCYHVLCDVCAEEEETVQCHAWQHVCSVEELMRKKKRTYTDYIQHSVDRQQNSENIWQTPDLLSQ